MPRNHLRVGGTPYVLDARPDRIDHRDRPYQPPLVSLPGQWPTERDIEIALPYFRRMIGDQGQEGACTGFGLAAVYNYINWRDHVLALRRGDRGLLAIDLSKVPTEQVSPYQLYHLARIYDEWEGEDYEGSSCRGAVKGFHKHGVCRFDLWPEQPAPEGEGRSLWQADAASRPLGAYYRIDRRSINDIQSAIFEVGAVYASARVHSGWDLGSSASLPEITRPPEFDGGDGYAGAHAFALVGYTPRGFIVQNSWGSSWGFHGFAILPYHDWVDAAMDAWAIVRGAPTLSVASAGARNVTSPEPPLGEAEFRLPADDCGQAVPPAVLQSFRIGSLSDASTRNVGWHWNEPYPSGGSTLTTRPLSVEEAYALTVVMANDGRPLRRRVGFDDVEDVVDEIAHDLPLRWWETHGDRFDHGFKLMLYVHGGLNSESDSVTRICQLAPYFLANGIYPLFISWRTSFLDSIHGILEDSLHRFFRPPSRSESLGWRDAIAQQVSEATDRAIEVACQHLLVKPVWTQMKQNAEAAFHEGRGMTLVVQALDRLLGRIGDCELHTIGHSAGALVLGHLMRRLKIRDMSVDSCRLFAPACTVGFAGRFYGPALVDEVLPAQEFYVHVLSDSLERRDRVGPYGKSLLYLISRALEINHKEPIFGMQAAWHFPGVEPPEDVWHIPPGDRDAGHRVNPDVHTWFEEFDYLIPQENLRLATEADVFNGREQIPQNHGSFDNNVDLMTECITQIRGREARPVVSRLTD